LKNFVFGCAVLAFLFAHPSAAQTAPDGTIVERVPCAARPELTYAQYVEERTATLTRAAGGSPGAANLAKRLLSKSDFEKRRGFEIECNRLVYMSDGLKVVAFLWKPRNTGGRKLPLVIFNRGGNRERSKLTPWMADGFYDYVSNGFVVLASQYRGVDGGEGKEEYGGADANDVLNLVPLAKSLDFVDTDNFFLRGHSRGGMMTYLALKKGIAVNAAAVTAGVSDLVGNSLDRPELIDMIYKDLIPDFRTRRDDAMRERSAVYWAEQLRAPLLIMHGTADEQIDARRTLELAAKLQEHGRTYELVMYAGDDHSLSLNAVEREQRVVDWFRRHMRSKPEPASIGNRRSSGDPYSAALRLSKEASCH
jgi:dipeptidyl aminopeptidase/acylaminoacyl peptidase